MSPKVLTDVIDALTEALEYFEDRQDIEDGGHIGPIPNAEMHLAQRCKEALDAIEADRTLQTLIERETTEAINEAEEARARHSRTSEL